ncbi:hypothetical protein KCP77_03080 [Salmonella enterica subsp. enterica]|nr:hypothetical protein KCP77_03080 [Salmonella enterica subsp. enterica]
MRLLAQQKPNDPEQSMLMGLSFRQRQTGAALRISIPCRPASGTAIFRTGGPIASATVLESANRLRAIAAKKPKRKRCYVSKPPSTRIELTLAAQQRGDTEAGPRRL